MNKASGEATSQRNPSPKNMTVDEARKVLWVSPNRRPVGELLDTGYIDQSRLEWAAANAYNPMLKQASQVLLDSLNQSPPEPTPEPNESPLPVRITLEQARATEWPLPPYKGQLMGTLVETKQVSLKDLGYAIENAWGERVRRAAIALTLVRLKQALEEPEPSTGTLHVVSTGRSYAERRQFFLTYLQGVVGGIFLGILMGILIAMVKSELSSPTGRPISEIAKFPISVVAVSIAILVGLGLGIMWATNFLLDQFTNRLDKSIAKHRQGQEGEERVVAALHQALDGNWHLFRNVTLPGRQKSDLDSVLVGPPGVWVLEVKTFTGEYKNTGEHWFYRARNKWKPASSNPSRQAEKNAIQLSDFFKADSISQWVDKAVVWANPECPVTVENPLVAVWTLERLPDELGNIWQDKTIPEDTRTRIVEKLTKLCEAQKAARQATK